MFLRLGLLTALLSIGCQDRTELVVGVATDLRAKGQIDRVEFVASRQGAPIVMNSWPLADVPAGMYELPGSFGLYSPDGSETRVELSLTGYRGNTLVADRESVLSLVSGQTLFLRLSITAACDPAGAHTCPGDENCAEGLCVKREIDAHRLPRYRKELVTNTECKSAASYIVSTTGKPMSALGDSCPAGNECHEGTCWKPPAQGSMFSGCIDLGDAGVLPDGGASLYTSSDLRVSNFPVAVGQYCNLHFYPYEMTINVGDSLQFIAGDGGTHHLRSGSFATPDLMMGPVTQTFTVPTDEVVTCNEHPQAGSLTVHVVN